MGAKMLIVVDPHSGVPAYKQLMDQVKFHVSSGLLRPGDELPSTRALSSQLGLNPMTISKAYSYLEKEGVVERRPGRPLVVKALETDRAAQRKIEQLRESLAPIVTIIRQLGIADDEALEILSEMLKEDSEPKGVGHGDGGSHDADGQGARSRETGDGADGIAPAPGDKEEKQ
jgi:GntR family transcriptional regulator